MRTEMKIKWGIYSVALMLMGAISISGALSVIAAHFPDQSQTMIQNLIAIPCLVIIVTTVATGKLLEKFSIKTVTIAGVLLFIFGGVIPAFLSSFTAILVCRGINAIGVGVGQVVCPAMIAQNFEGAERDKVQGTMTGMQMLGCCLMVFAGGWLGDISWDKAFYVHLVGIISLIGAIWLLPGNGPAKVNEALEKAKAVTAQKVKLTAASWHWAIAMFFTFIIGQIYSLYMAFIVTEKSLGTAADAGNSLAFFCLGGIVMGVLYGKLASRTRNQTMAVAFVGCALSYALIGLAGSMLVIHLGSVIFGMAISICMACVVVGTANSVDPFSASVAIAITMCAQNVAQFLCPYMMNVIAEFMKASSPAQFIYLFGAAVEIVMAVYAFAWGIRRGKLQRAVK